MSEFTYQKPDEKKYYQAVLAYLKKKGEDDLYNSVKTARCSISESSTFSKRRWNALYTKIVFQVPFEDFQEIDDSATSRLRHVCAAIMPPDVGFDVMDVEFVPIVDDPADSEDLASDLTKISASLREISTSFSLPRDIIDKGNDMAEVYLYLYVVENSLRMFVEAAARNEFGTDFFQKLNVPSDIKRGLEIRKKEESKNQWISVRGDSSMFYLDFKDIATLILNNWQLFKGYFPNQGWISTKINELAECRNLVAHNSYLGKHERDVIRVNYNSIVKQISSALD
jgi:hypothetical protein